MIDPQLQRVLDSYGVWKQLPDGRYAAVSGEFTFGKARILVGLDYCGYSEAY